MANEKRLVDANDFTKYLEENLAIWKHPEALDWAIGKLRREPPVDAVEVVHAEWLDGYGVCDNKKSYVSIDCSNCGEYFKIPGVDEDIEKWKKRFAYCPFCGAKMDGGNEK